MTAYRTDLRVALYGDSNCNLVDGSTIWLQSTAHVLAQLGLDDVELVLKAPIERDVILRPLLQQEGLRLVEPDEPLTSAAAAQAVAARSPDVVLVRGSRVSLEMARIPSLDGRLWTYLTDIPQHPLQATPEQVEDLTEIVEASDVVLCQTEALRGLLETLVPAACGRTDVFPPMLPIQDMPQRQRRLDREDVRLAYAGKFAPRWRTLEMTDLPRRFAREGVDVEVEFIGDKIHAGPAGAAYRRRMREALEQRPGVDWRGAMPRSETFARLCQADFGLAWRDPELDVSLELSTKLLEYGALRLPALMNRTDEHVTLFGEDYPLYVDSPDAIVRSVTACLDDPDLHELAASRLAHVAEQHSFDRAAERVGQLLGRRHPRRRTGSSSPVRVLVASHDLKFFEPIADFIGRLPGVELQYDHWSGLTEHDAAASRRALGEADIVFCEWAGPNAVWYARHVQEGQRLVVRLHRFELYRPWPEALDIDRIDRVVCVNDRYRDLALARLGWPAEKVEVIPNLVDTAALARPKAPGAAFRVGMIGVSSRRKRLDLGLEVLAGLRRRDPRFTLTCKSHLPFEHDWVWRQARERRAFEAVRRRIEQDPDVRGAVHVDGFGPDVGHWLRRVGWVLSTSDDESFHLATAEGMASGAVPVVRNWEGSDAVYDAEWIHQDVASMVDQIAEAALGGTWQQLAARARTQAEPWDLVDVARQFEQAVLGEVTGA